VLQYPDGTYRSETTTLAYDLEGRHKERSVIPDDRAVAFVCDFLEDLADEWAVKPLFLYRWWDPEDQAYVSRGPGENGRGIGGPERHSGRNRAIPAAAGIAHGRSRRDGREKAAAGRVLLTDVGSVRATCRHDQLSVRQPAVDRRFRWLSVTMPSSKAAMQKDDAQLGAGAALPDRHRCPKCNSPCMSAARIVMRREQVAVTAA